MKHIATIKTGFTENFGIPRQSGLAESLKADIIFCPEFRNPDSLRGLDGFSHIWLIWKFSKSDKSGSGWLPTVRPPRLGGNTRMGVFATRSPFRPNPIGLSCVKLEGIDLHTPEGPVLHVSGADLADDTPIYDIKPYVPYTDCRPDATEGYTKETRLQNLKVVFPHDLALTLPAGMRQQLTEILAQDPRPHYQNDPERLYGMTYCGNDVKFTVEDDTLTVRSVEKLMA
ncbi:MAG: tRNA (N6-threonylcarbamoyladenosine(37)-N6)-methyltransferase TrmO [Bacteroidaceae bacterium]|nr:tRNA (N6-threonylcarbamoyladenosine(37)-N6)-methyltransferase TrmO [Bacteroidaceae bacterium]